MGDYSFLDNVDSIQNLLSRPYSLRPGAEDPLSSFFDEVPEITHSLSGSSDPPELGDSEWAIQNDYGPSTGPPVIDGEAFYPETQRAQWVDYFENLKIVKPQIYTEANLSRAKAEKCLSNYSRSPSSAQLKRPRGRRISSLNLVRYSDAYGKTDGDTGSEYLPSQVPKKRKRICSPSPTTTTCTSVSSEHGSSSPRKRFIKKGREPPDSRNRQAKPEEWEGIRVAIDGNILKNGQCSYCGKSISTRAPDVRRHMKTHLPRQVMCTGVPLNEADPFRIPTDAERYLYNGELYIGGCMQLFSRPDALKRHLDNSKTGCVSRRTS